MDDLILSQDGSHTVVVSDRFGVSYHSKYGAVQETQTVFIDAGLRFQVEQNKDDLSILEMGFGTGLNALMTLIQVNGNIRIDYTTIEAYPLIAKQYHKLNYPDILKLDNPSREAFLKMHSCNSGVRTIINEQFIFTKFIQKIEDFSSSSKFDVIYYDAFAPSSQEELWSEEMMSKIYEFCNPGAVLVTYCAKGSFKRALKSTGFSVEGLDGPIGKREMTRAHKPII